MKKIIKLTESDLTRIVRRVINESRDYEDGGFLKGMKDFLDNSEPFPDCPICGGDTALDDNGDYEFFFCTNMDSECGWESEPGEYGLEVHNDDY